MLLLVSMNNVEKFINLFECFSLISNNKSFEIIIILKIKKKRKRLNFKKKWFKFYIIEYSDYAFRSTIIRNDAFDL